MAKNKSELDKLKETYERIKKRSEELKKELTEDQIQKIIEDNKDLSDRMHWESFGYLDGQEPPEFLDS